MLDSIFEGEALSKEIGDWNATNAENNDPFALTDKSNNQNSKTTHGHKRAVSLKMMAKEKQRCHKRSMSFDIRALVTKEDFVILHDKDPFMYYSIPDIHNATILGNHSVSDSDTDDDASCQEVGQFLLGNNDVTSKKPRPVVNRRSRISFEADPSFLMNAFISGETDNEASSGNDNNNICRQRSSDECEDEEAKLRLLFG